MSEMSGPSKRPDWIDPDPTAGHELCVCGSGYVPIGTVCRECDERAHLATLREVYPRDEAEVRAIIESEYAERHARAMFSHEIVRPVTAVEVWQVASASDPGYFAGKVLQIWTARAETGAEVAVWLVVGPDPWEIYPAGPVGSLRGALDHYRMTQRYDADGWPLDFTTGQREEEP